MPCSCFWLPNVLWVQIHKLLLLFGFVSIQRMSPFNHVVIGRTSNDFYRWCRAATPLWTVLASQPLCPAASEARYPTESCLTMGLSRIKGGMNFRLLSVLGVFKRHMDCLVTVKWHCSRSQGGTGSLSSKPAAYFPDASQSSAALSCVSPRHKKTPQQTKTKKRRLKSATVQKVEREA